MAKKTGMIKWDEELAKAAAESAALEAGVGSSDFFSTQNGILSFDGTPVKDNVMNVVILDHILENTYYEGEFDSDNPSPPKCFAFGRGENAEKTMGPHEVCKEDGSAEGSSEGKCEGCPMNEWGTGRRGRGKACTNRRRLAVISAGPAGKGKGKLVSDPKHFETAKIGFLKIGPTSLKGYAAFVKQLRASLNRPPWGIVTKVGVERKPGEDGFIITFEPQTKLPDEILGVVKTRVDEAKVAIEAPYAAYSTANGAPTPRRGAKKGKKAARQAPPRRQVPPRQAPKTAASTRTAKF